MKHSPKIIVLSGGGLARALNATLYGVIAAAQAKGMPVFGGMKGWHCFSRDGRIVELKNFDPQLIRDVGGTFLRSSRTNPFKEPGIIETIIRQCRTKRFDAIVAIGGDDTLGAARRLFEEYRIPVVGVPKTSDNDLAGTYWTPGFPSAAWAIAEYTARIRRDAAYAVERVFVIEVMGGHAGWVAAASAYGLADVIIPPEKKISLKRALKRIKAAYRANGNFAVVVVQEEAQFDEPISGFETSVDSYGVERHEFISYALRREIEHQLKIPSRNVIPGHHISAGEPIAIDRDFAISLGQRAIELVIEEKFGWVPVLERPSFKSSRIVVTEKPLREVAGKKNYRSLDDRYFDFTALQPTKHFFDYMAPILGELPREDNYYRLIKGLSK